MLRLLSFLLLTFTLTIGSATAQTYNTELERWDYQSDIKFTGTLKLPTKTTTQRNALTASEGMVIYNTTLDSVQVYRNSSWVTLGGSSAGGENYWELNANQLRPSVEHDGFYASSGGDYAYPAELLINNVTGRIYRQTLTSRSQVGIDGDSAFAMVFSSGDTAIILAEKEKITLDAFDVVIRNNESPVNFTVNGAAESYLSFYDYGDGMSEFRMVVTDTSISQYGYTQITLNPFEGFRLISESEDYSRSSKIYCDSLHSELFHEVDGEIFRVRVDNDGVFIDDSNTFTAGDILVNNGSGYVNWQHFAPPTYTATEASALTPANGWQIYVSSTNGTFTAVGFWGYVNGTWTALH